jgi:hypothetical protein
MASGNYKRLDAVQVTTLFEFTHSVRLTVIVPLAVVAELKLPTTSMNVGVLEPPTVNVNDGVGVVERIGAPGDKNPPIPPEHPGKLKPKFTVIIVCAGVTVKLMSELCDVNPVHWPSYVAGAGVGAGAEDGLAPPPPHDAAAQQDKTSRTTVSRRIGARDYSAHSISSFSDLVIW